MHQHPFRLFILSVLLASFFTSLTASNSSSTANQTHPQPSLIYNTTDGRFRVISHTKPTVSIYWDNIAQQLVANTVQGPTIASFAYVLLHSAIFDAWRTNRHSDVPWWKKAPSWRKRLESKKPTNPECSLKRLTMHYAAYFSLVRSFPRHRTAIARALSTVEKRCTHGPHLWRSKQMARHIVDAAYWRYNTRVYHLRRWKSTHLRSSIEVWRPERIPIDSDDGPTQVELTPSWGLRYTFGVRNGGSIRVPAPKRFLHIDAKLDMSTRTVSFRNGTRIEFTPQLINPKFIAQAKRVVKASATSTPEQRFSAEAWEAGGRSSYPPGAWLTIAQLVSARARHDDSEDAGLFFAMANALSDASIATWFTKYRYRYARPVRVIRDLGELGVLGDVRIYNPSKSAFENVSATKFTTYQRPGGEPSPSFPEYTSGHSSFSGAAAEVLKRWKGSDVFNAGISLPAYESRFERGRAPEQTVKLYWKTFTDAANEAGLSRIYGGIHFDDANIQGLKLGREIGKKAFLRANFLWSNKLF